MSNSRISESFISLPKDVSSSDDEPRSRFVVGIDLGTTNSAVAFVDTETDSRKIVSFPILQAVAPNLTERRLTLPSFACQTPGFETIFPWQEDWNDFAGSNDGRRRKKSPAFENVVVGTFARDFGGGLANYVSSAKSWLSHSGVDRTAQILPWLSISDSESLDSINDESSSNVERNDATTRTTKSKETKSEQDAKTSDARRWSPVEVSSFYLTQIRRSWNDRFPDFPLEEQDVVLTLPASFDEVARELTILAAKRTGLSRITLIEEPQAAFYSWIYCHENDWKSQIRPGQKILICDVGGGTTDLTLIRVREKEKINPQDFSKNQNSDEPKTLKSFADSVATENAADSPNSFNVRNQKTDFNENLDSPENRETFFHRIAVGDHLILGGDNFDLAIARHLEERLKNEGKLTKTQNRLPFNVWKSLIRSSCRIKELFLSDASLKNVPASVSGLSGSKLIGGSVVLNVSRAEIEKIVLDGFFPSVSLQTKPERRRLGLQEFGLPYASDPAITKHLAQFLTTHRFSGDLSNSPSSVSNATFSPNSSEQSDPARPDVVLFNGGVFRSQQLQRRIVENLERWFASLPTQRDQTANDERVPNDASNETRRWSPIVLENENLDLAVSRGAAYYGMVRRGIGMKISASLARTYYIGVLAPKTTADRLSGLENGDEPIGQNRDGESATAPKSPDSNESETTTEIQALCLIPASLEPGEEIVLNERQFELIVGNPISFPFFVSSVRLTDRPGDFCPIRPEEMKVLPEIQTVLKTRSKAKLEAGTVRAELAARLTELGTVELFLREVPSPQNKRRLAQWKLQFDVRSATQTDVAVDRSTGNAEGILDESLVEAVRVCLTEALTPSATTETKTNSRSASSPTRSIEKNVVENDSRTPPPLKPSELMKKLSEIVELPKEEFLLPLLRRTGEFLLDLDAGRQKSPAWESRWLNLLGFSFRPGFGVPLDDWRIDRLWKILSGNLIHSTLECRTQIWILWRRIAAGLSAGRQQTLIEPILSNVRNLRRQLVDGRGKGPDFDFSTQEGAEIWRLIGSFEKIPVETKIEFGNLILETLDKKKLAPVGDAMIWAIGRLGSRRMFQAPLDAILPPSVVENWIQKLLQRRSDRFVLWFALMQLARKTDDRSLDVGETVRDSVVGFLVKNGAPEHFVRLVSEREELQAEETKTMFGDSLPLGLTLAER